MTIFQSFKTLRIQLSAVHVFWLFKIIVNISLLFELQKYETEVNYDEQNF
jgi:hypothetical protein